MPEEARLRIEDWPGIVMPPLVETERVEYKDAGVALASEYQLHKAALALSNTQDGGYLVLGVSQRGDKYDAVGIPTDLLSKINLDELQRKLSDSGSPRPRVTLEVKEHEEKQFIVMAVAPSLHRPVIATKDIGVEVTPTYGVRKGVVYYRNVGAESCPATATDWEEIIRRYYTNERVSALAEARAAGILIEASSAASDDEQFRKDSEDFL